MDKREYNREYHKKWYGNPENAARQKANARLHREGKRERNRAFVNEYKRSHPCACGEDHVACLDFHHTGSPSKDRAIADMVRDMCSLDRLAEEIGKCVVLCRNCHAKLHSVERLRRE
jgi:hypothetical protein